MKKTYTHTAPRAVAVAVSQAPVAGFALSGMFALIISLLLRSLF